MEEEIFPRGGIVKTGSKRGGNKPKNDNNDLFKISEAIPQEKKSKSKKKEKKAAKSHTTVKQDVISKIDTFSVGMISEDMLLYGRIKEILDYKLIVNLPENILGEVAITDISGAYTTALKSIIKNDIDSSEIASLDDMFKVGQTVTCRVKRIKSKSKKKGVLLTLDPKIINRDIDIDKLNPQTVLQGCVSSCEDHGYTIELGIKDVQAFVLNADAAKFDSKPLPIGIPVQCTITKAGLETLKSRNNRVVNVKLKSNNSTRVVDTRKDVSLTNLLPGTVVSGEVSAIQENGILVTFLGKFRGAIHRHQLNADPSKFKKEQVLKMCILFHVPLVGVSYLSTLPHLIDPACEKAQNHELVQIGDIIESANVLHIDQRSGALLKLKEQIHGYLPLRFVNDNVKKRNFTNFPKTGIKCRIVNFDLMNNVAIVSTCKSFLDRSIISLNECKPGVVVQGQIQRFIKGHIIVVIAGFYRGFIPAMHNANVPLKFPERKYKVEDTIQCRVLKIEKASRHSLSLTAKESLVQSDIPPLTSFDTLEKGMIVEGYIVKINRSGLVVAFYNDVRGFVHKSEAGDDLNILDENFYLGQVVKCRVLSWDAETEKMLLTMKLDGKENVGVKEMKLQADLDASKIHSCQITKIADRGITVRVGRVAGFIPVHHLSDNYVNCKHLLRLYKPHQVIDTIVLFERAATPIFTVKPSMLQAVEKKPLPESLDDLLPGSIVPGVVRNAVDFGLFVQLSHNLRGVAANKFICDQYSEDATSRFKSGQSVLVNVKSLDHERNRIACSLRMSDCYHGDTRPSLDQLASFLDERQRILSYYSKYGNDAAKNITGLEVGSVIDVEIEEVNDFGSVGHEVNTKVKVICTVFHMEGCTVKVGETRRAVVLYQDIDFKCLEVTMSKKNVKAISHRTDGPSNQVKEGSVNDAQVLLVKPEFVVIALRGRAEHKLAYAPAQKCLNDVTGSSFFEPGFSDRVLIHKITEDHVMCSWQAYEVTGKLNTPRRLEVNQLNIGDRVRAVVREILPFQLNIRIGNLPGRIFASEIETEDFVPGDRLSDRFKSGDQIDAVIIGFRDTKSQKLSHNKGASQRGIPECSTLKRRLAGDMAEPLYQPGQSLAGFYYQTQKEHIRFRISLSMNGHCKFLNSDLDLNDLHHPDNLHAGAYYPLTYVGPRDNGCEVSMVEDDLDEGSVVTCMVSRFKKDSLVVKLPHQYRGTVSLTEMSDEFVDDVQNTFTEGQYVRGKIIGKTDNVFLVSLRKSRYTPFPLRVEPKDKVIESKGDLIEHEILRGYVHKVAQHGVTVLLGDDVYAYAKRENLSDHHVAKMKAAYPKGRVVAVKILRIGEEVQISMKESDTGGLSRKRRLSETKSESEGPPSRRRKTSESEVSPRKRTESGSEFQSPALGTRKRRLSEMSDPKEDGDDQEVDLENLPLLDLGGNDSSSDEEPVKPKAKVAKIAKKKKKEKTKTEKSEAQPATTTTPCLDVNEKFQWVTKFKLPTASRNDSDSSDEEDEKVVEKEDKKLEEKKLVEMENRLLDTSRTPETEDEFDRLVVQTPDNSIVWIQYMAHHLKMAEIDKARSVAERALKTISFREEQEKLNVWAALLNLENTYGTPDQLKFVFDRAVQTNDSIKVHYQLVKIYETSGKTEQAERLYSSMVRQFGVKKQIWMDFGTFYFKQNRFDSARKLLERGLKIMDKRDHVEVVNKFGRLEFEHGQNETAIQLFEQVLAECPKRLDVWNVYLDLLVKFSTVEKVRRTFLKILDISFPPKKMKSVYKKWLDFETKHGDESSVQDVKDRASKYAQENIGG